MPRDMYKQIENAFTYHSPQPHQVPKYTEIRDTAKDFAHMLNDLCPESRELCVAITKLEECVMWANASIAREE
jgi:hypothetical protein